MQDQLEARPLRAWEVFRTGDPRLEKMPPVHFVESEPCHQCKAAANKMDEKHKVPRARPMDSVRWLLMKVQGVFASKRKLVRSSESHL